MAYVQKGMPRTPRIVVPGFPHHVVHRGHNRQRIFFGDWERRFYIDNLKTLKGRFGCLVHAFALMSNHIHLVVNPGEDPRSLGKLMQILEARQTRLVNRLRKRSGTLWESRYKSSPIGADEYLLACCRYVDLNPVRASIVARPEEYRWSSCRGRLGLEPMEWLDLDPAFLALGESDSERRDVYRKLLEFGVEAGQLKTIRDSLQQGQPVGSSLRTRGGQRTKDE